MLLYADIIHCIVLIETREEIMIERKEKQDDARNTTQLTRFDPRCKNRS